MSRVPLRSSIWPSFIATPRKSTYITRLGRMSIGDQPSADSFDCPEVRIGEVSEADIIQFGRRLLRRLHSVPVDRKRGRVTFLDRERWPPRSFQLTLGNCPSAWVLSRRLARVLTCGATLEQHKDGSELVSATE